MYVGHMSYMSYVSHMSNFFLNHLKLLFFVFEKYGIFLLIYKDGKKRKY